MKEEQKQELAEQMSAPPSETKRITVLALEEILYKPFPVLDKGFVRVVDYQGSDATIVRSARVSYGQGTKRVSEDEGLIRYLMRHRHTTPTEQCEIAFHVRVPIDCWRQWIRHRTASTNEYSTRYSEAIDANQQTDPGEWRSQSGRNKQGSEGMVTEWPQNRGLVDFETPGAYLSFREVEFQEEARRIYENRLEFGVAREQARKDLPLSTYCYDAATEVLTESGFVPWPDVTDRMKIGSWDSRMQSLYYEFPEYLIIDEHEGPMYRVNHRGADLLVTPNHKMWVKLKRTAGWDSAFSLISTEQLGHRSLVRYTKLAPLNIGDEWQPSRALGTASKSALLELMGFFVGDEHAPKSGYANALVFNLRKVRKIKFLGGVCEKTGWPCELKSGSIFVVLKEGVTSIFRDLFYDPETGSKRLPDFVRRLTTNDAQSFLIGLRNSDGCVYGKKHDSWRFDTTSPQVAECVMQLGIHAGEAVNGPWITEKDSENHEDVYHVQFFGRGKEPVVNQMTRNTSFEHYSGKVYCAKTKTGILVIRRNGKVCLSGNSEAYWKIDLHNLFHFLSLRMDSHAQLEIRSYANVIGNEIVARWCPLAWKAFQDYRLNAMHLTAQEIGIIQEMLKSDEQIAVGNSLADDFGWLKQAKKGGLRRNRERDECEAKLMRLGLPVPWVGE